ncbi:MAG: hypothetical protein QW835_00600 [Candidatus Hadarchaeum sp.]
MPEFVFSRVICCWEYFVVEAKDEEEALRILEEAEDPYVYHDETITELELGLQKPKFELIESR